MQGTGEPQPRTAADAFFADRSKIPISAQSYFIYSAKETWYYEGFQVTFETYDMRGKWRFGGYLYEEVIAMLEQGLEPVPSGTEVFNKRPPRFVDPYKQLKYQPPHLIAAFREGRNTRVELAYALPKDRLDIRADAVDLLDGFFLFDQNWGEVQRDVQRLSQLSSLGTDSLRNSYLLAQRTVRLKPGDYTLVSELLDRRTNAIGSVRQAFTFTIKTDRWGLIDR